MHLHDVLDKTNKIDELVIFFIGEKIMYFIQVENVPERLKRARQDSNSRHGCKKKQYPTHLTTKARK